MIATYKLLTNQLKIKGEELFSIGNVTTRRHKYKLFKQHATKFVRPNAFPNRIVTDWNSLPEYVVEAPSTDVFKKGLDDHWKERKYITPFRPSMAMYESVYQQAKPYFFRNTLSYLILFHIVYLYRR